jgi:hypothetical protein
MQEYIDAAGRWAILKLVNTRIVSDEGEERAINVEKVLSCTEYIERLPVTKEFLTTHKEHEIIFTALDSIYETGEWLELLPTGRIDPYDMKPRCFVEKLNFTKWEEVEDYLKKLDNPPIWVEDEGYLRMAKEKFKQLVKDKVSH